MNCPKCGQEMIDVKDYCVNCGAKLREEKMVSKKRIIFIFLGLIVLGALTCYLIINLNTDKEIEPYLKKDEIKEK